MLVLNFLMMIVCSVTLKCDICFENISKTKSLSFSSAHSQTGNRCSLNTFFEDNAI